uniref:Uncharacterized protein n=1 Tax=Desertifilum tharense IPPAS B-1220 TaxID=1781255 RepID=A0ACD5GNH7_9CYAN
MDQVGTPHLFSWYSEVLSASLSAECKVLSAELKPSESHPLSSSLCPNLTKYSYNNFFSTRNSELGTHFRLARDGDRPY